MATGRKSSQAAVSNGSKSSKKKGTSSNHTSSNRRVTSSRTVSNTTKGTQKRKNISHKKEEKHSFPLKREIIVIAVLAISVLILISCFSDETSPIWWLHFAVFFHKKNLFSIFPCTRMLSISGVSLYFFLKKYY